MGAFLGAMEAFLDAMGAFLGVTGAFLSARGAFLRVDETFLGMRGTFQGVTAASISHNSKLYSQPPHHKPVTHRSKTMQAELVHTTASTKNK